MKNERPLRFIASSKDDLSEMPLGVKRVFGFALRMAQNGEKHEKAKPLTGDKDFKGSGVLEVVEDHDGDTYRAVYTVRFRNTIYVLHAFQKKSKKGIATPKADLDLIKRRLKVAAADAEKETKK